MVLRTAGLLLMMLHPAAALATPQLETTAPADTGRSHAFCLRARPASHCGSFLTTELMYEWRLYSTKVPGVQDRPDFEGRLMGAVGAMVNVSQHDAAGITAVFSTDGMSPRVEARYRRWASPSTALDLSVGVGQADMLATEDVVARATGVTLSGAVMRSDLIGANIRLEWERGGGRSPFGAFFGARVGSYLAPIGAAALLGVLLIAASNGAFD